ncbi:MAG TPA: PEP-CTERM sorting domain-containing protein [Gemmataceae bacterium]
MPRDRPIIFALPAVFALAWPPPPLCAQPLYTARTLDSQIPSGDGVVATAAISTPAGVQIVGARRFHNGGGDATPAFFPTATSNVQLMTNPPSDSTQGVISAAAYVPSLGVLDAGSYEKAVGSTQSTHPVVWTGTPNSGVDLGQPAPASDSGVSAVSAAPVGFQAVGGMYVSGEKQAVMWTGPTLQSPQIVTLHNPATMFQSQANGAYTFNGVAKQVGYSNDILPGGLSTQPRARVWSGTAASAVDLTPPGYLYAAITAGNGDGPVEILSGHLGLTISDLRPAVWRGTGGAFQVLNTPPGRPAGSVFYSSQTSGVGLVAVNANEASPHAALWNLLTGAVTDLHSFLPPEFQIAGAASTAFYVDAAGNVYGQATISEGGEVGVPVVWLAAVPEPSTLSLSAAVALAACAVRRVRRRRSTGIVALADRRSED